MKTTDIKIESAIINEGSIKGAEEHYSAKYILEYDNKAYFYADNVHPISGSRYFSLYRTIEDTYIRDGSDIESMIFNGAIANNGDIIYSHNRHDYRVSKDKSVWIDGGQDYIRSGNFDNLVTFMVKDGKLVFIEKE